VLHTGAARISRCCNCQCHVSVQTFKVDVTLKFERCPTPAARLRMTSTTHVDARGTRAAVQCHHDASSARSRSVATHAQAATMTRTAHMHAYDPGTVPSLIQIWPDPNLANRKQRISCWNVVWHVTVCLDTRQTPLKARTLLRKTRCKEAHNKLFRFSANSNSF